MGIIEDLFIGKEIMELYNQNVPMDEIRNRMIIAHPEINKMPSLPTFYRFVEWGSIQDLFMLLLCNSNRRKRLKDS